MVTFIADDDLTQELRQIVMVQYSNDLRDT